MSQHFFDTSGLVKHYHAEIGSAAVDRWWADPAARLYISRQGVVEAVSVFARKVRTGAISTTDFGLLRRRLFADIRHRRPSSCACLAGTSRKQIDKGRRWRMSAKSRRRNRPKSVVEIAPVRTTR